VSRNDLKRDTARSRAHHTLAKQITEGDYDFTGALCAQVDPDLWFPRVGQGDKSTAAIAICNECPVKDACLQYVLENGEEHGIWGGTTPSMRRRMKKSNRVKPIDHGTDAGYAAHYRRGVPYCRPCRDAHTRACREQQARRKMAAVKDLQEALP